MPLSLSTEALSQTCGIYRKNILMKRTQRLSLIIGTSGGVSAGVSGGLAAAMNLSPDKAVVVALLVGVIVSVAVLALLQLVLPKEKR